MTTTINASTSSGLVVTPDNSGNIVLQYNGVSTPTFSAYVTGNQTISAGAWTKVQINTKEWDTASCFNTSTYRYVPNVAGYYMFTGQTSNQSGGGNRVILAFYKNGTLARFGTDIGVTSGTLGNGSGPVASAQIYCNGTTDYVELYIYDSGGQVVNGGNAGTTSFFQGFLVRGA